MSTPNEHLDQFNAAVDATRVALLVELDKSRADADRAQSDREAAARDKWAALEHVANVKQLRLAITKIEDLARRAQLMTTNLNVYAKGGRADAQSATGAMADAAAHVKQTANVLEGLTQVVHGVSAITGGDDRHDDLLAVGEAARDAVERAREDAKLLKVESIEASIRAAMPLASTVAEAVSLLYEQVAAMATDALSSLGGVRAAVDAAVVGRGTTWTRYYTTVAPFEQAALKHQALDRSFDALDATANDGLRVTLDNVAGVAGLRAIVSVLPDDLEGKYRPPRFFAVRELDAYRFTYAAAAARHGEDGGDEGVRRAGETYHQRLVRSTDGNAITYGTTYRVYAVRGPRVTATADDTLAGPDAHEPHPHHGDRVMPASPHQQVPPRVSMPSRPILATLGFAERQVPVVTLLDPNGQNSPFLVTFDLGPDKVEQDQSKLDEEYYLVILPSGLWPAQQADGLALVSRASLTDCVSLDPIPAADVPATLRAVTGRLYDDLRLINPAVVRDRSREDFAQRPPVRLGQSAGDFAARPSRLTIAYFSPVLADQNGHEGDEKYAFGHYNDMNGQEIDLPSHEYRAAVLVVSKAKNSPVVQSYVLSNPSLPFAVRIDNGAAVPPRSFAPPPNDAPRAANVHRLTNSAIALS